MTVRHASARVVVTHADGRTGRLLWVKAGRAGTVAAGAYVTVRVESLRVTMADQPREMVG